MKPNEVYDLTQKEFYLLMESEIDKKMDKHQTQAMYTMWIRHAYHSKKLKQTDLFNPKEFKQNTQSKESFEELQAKMNEQQAFLDSLFIGNTANTNEEGGE